MWPFSKKPTVGSPLEPMTSTLIRFTVLGMNSLLWNSPQIQSVSSGHPHTSNAPVAPVSTSLLQHAGTSTG